MDVGIYSSEGYFENGIDLGLSRDFVDSCDGVWWRVRFDNKGILVSGFFWAVKPNREGRWERVVVCSRMPYSYNDTLVDLLCEFFESARRELNRYGYINKIDNITELDENRDISSNIIYKMITSKRKGFDILVNLQKSISITSSEKEPTTTEKISYGYYVLWIFEHLKGFLKRYNIDIALSKMKISNSINFNEQTGNKLEDLVRKKAIYGEEYLRILHKYYGKSLNCEFGDLDDEVWKYLIWSYIKNGKFNKLLKKYENNPEKLAKICYALGRLNNDNGFKIGGESEILKSNNLHVLLYAFKSKLIKSKKYNYYIGIGLQNIYNLCDTNERENTLNEIFHKKIWDISLKNKASKLINNPALLNQIHNDTNVITKIKNKFNELNKEVNNSLGMDIIELVLIVLAILIIGYLVMEYGHTVVNWIFEHIIDPITNSINGVVNWIKHLTLSNHPLSSGGNNTTNVSTIANQSTHNASMLENIANPNNA
jgi:hypothetical protein